LAQLLGGSALEHEHYLPCTFTHGIPYPLASGGRSAAAMKTMASLQAFSLMRWLLLLCWLGCGAALAQDATVAVWDFDSQELSTQPEAQLAGLSRALPEMLVEQLLSTPGVRVIERIRLREILDEQKLGSSVLADEAARLRLGRLAGAQHMVFGSLLSIAGITRVDVRLVSVATSQVLVSQEASGPAPELAAQMQGVGEALGRALGKSQEGARPGSASHADAKLLSGFDEGLALMDRKDFAGAIERFKALLQTHPDFTPAERQLRTALEQLSRQ
jgi:TolB-like protein